MRPHEQQHGGATLPRRHELLLLQQFVSLWLARWREQIPTLRRIARLAHEAGDFENATFAALIEVSLSFYPYVPSEAGGLFEIGSFTDFSVNAPDLTFTRPDVIGYY